MKFQLSPDHLELRVNSKQYSLDVLFKCFYWYGDKYLIEIDEKDSKTNQVIIKPRRGKLDDNENEELIEKIKTDLIDFKVRDIVTKETQNVRDLLIAKAFSHSDQYDEKPPDDI